MEMSDFFTWEALSTPAGAAIALFFIIQFSKKMVERIVPWLPTDILSVIIATIILILANLALGANGYDWKLYAMAFFNAFIVASIAGHVHTKTTTPPSLAKYDSVKRGEKP